MSVSSIFAKIDDLERKVSSLASSVSAAASAPAQSGAAGPVGPAIDVEDVLKRLSAVEALVAAFSQPDIDQVNSRLSLLEAKVMPVDLPEKVEAIQSTMTNFQNAVTGHSGDIHTLVDKLNHLETVTLPHILTRLENLEHQLAQPSN